MRRALLALALASSAACARHREPPEQKRAPDDRSAPSGARAETRALLGAELDLTAQAAARPRPRERRVEVAPAELEHRSRGPWLDSIDTIARRYPTFGVTLYHMAYVYEAPRKDARPVGYLRRGARFRASEEVSQAGCPRGWFEIAGGGYVCSGDGVSVDAEPPSYNDPPILPALSDALPYRYTKVVAQDVPQYLRLPTSEEERAVASSLSTLTLNDAGVPVADGLPPELSPLVRLRMQPGFYVSVDRELESELHERTFVRTVRGGLIRKEQVVDAKLPSGLGVSLGSRDQLPMAFVYRSGAPSLRLDPVTGELAKAAGDLPLHSAHALTGQSLVKGGRRYFLTRDGLLLRDTAIRIVDRVARPKQIPRAERWIRVDLDRQTLTAYEGETPVFATLVSSGLPDHATPAGLYRLHAKHVTTTMADDLAADGPYSIEDVPWTMYFLGSYALHAAFWHERFGHPRSHGCVNLAPRDARWLFFWTLPELPSAWHGVLADVGKGTTILLDSAVSYPIEQGG